jgi:hypothetical protein
MNKQLVIHEFIKCGKEFGATTAEFIVLHFLPDDKKENGVCSDVPPESHNALVESFRVGRITLSKERAYAEQ